MENKYLLVLCIYTQHTQFQFLILKKHGHFHISTHIRWHISMTTEPAITIILFSCKFSFYCLICIYGPHSKTSGIDFCFVCRCHLGYIQGDNHLIHGFQQIYRSASTLKSMLIFLPLNQYEIAIDLCRIHSRILLCETERNSLKEELETKNFYRYKNCV